MHSSGVIDDFSNSSQGVLEYETTEVRIMYTPHNGKRMIYDRNSQIRIEVSNSKKFYSSGYFEKFVNLFDSGILDRLKVGGYSTVKIVINAGNLPHCNTLETVAFIIDSEDLTDASKIATVISYLTNCKGLKDGSPGLSKELVVSIAKKQIDFDSISDYTSIDSLKCYLYPNFLALTKSNPENCKFFGLSLRYSEVTSTDKHFIEFLKLQAFLESSLPNEVYGDFKVRTRDDLLIVTQNISLNLVHAIEGAVIFIEADPSEYLISTPLEIIDFLENCDNYLDSRILKEYKRTVRKDIVTFKDSPLEISEVENLQHCEYFDKYLTLDEIRKLNILFSQASHQSVDTSNVHKFLVLILCSVFINLDEDRFVDFLKEILRLGIGKPYIRENYIVLSLEEYDLIKKIYFAIIDKEYIDYPVSWIAEIV